MKKLFFSKPVHNPQRVRRDFMAPASRGFSTIEILIAFAVGIIFLTAAMMVAFSDPTLARQISLDSGQAAAFDSQRDNRGLASSTNKFGELLATLAADWTASLSTTIQDDPECALFSDRKYCFKYMPPVVVDISPCVKEVVNETNWNSLYDRDRHITFGTAISDMDVAQALGPGGCDPTPSTENWKRPTKYPNGISVSSVNANDLVILTHNSKRIVVLAATPSGGGGGASAFPDLYTYDLTDPSNPSGVLGSINTGKGLNAIATDGTKYIFALQNDSSNQLQVIRIFDTTKSATDPLYYQPTLVTPISLQDVAGAHPEGRSIAYYNKHLYIGTWNNNAPVTSPEFLIYDVSSPTNPIYKGKINLSTSVNAIAISGKYAYLATTNDGGEMMVIDIENPSAPSVVASFNIDTANNNVDAEEIYVLGNKAYVGMNRNTGSGRGELIIINIGNPLAPTLYANMPLNLKNSTKVTGIHVHDRYAFVGTDVSNEEFRVIDIKDPTNPVMLECSPYNYSAKVSAVKYSNGYVFISNQANDALRVIYNNASSLSCPA